MKSNPIHSSSAKPQLLGETCTKHITAPTADTTAARHSIHVGSVQICRDAKQADQLLGQEIEGFAYQRTGHANEFVLNERCRELHQADFAAVTPSGMAALSLALLATTKSGDHVLVSNQLYGTTESLFGIEAARFGIEAEHFDIFDLEQARSKINRKTRLIIAETISNPLMRVADISALAEIATESGALLLIDNTFASPIVCQPLELGANLVMESLTKIMNGHSDVLMGVLCGRDRSTNRDLATAIDRTQRNWGLVGAPFDCWLADRGLGTLNLRASQASRSAMELASELKSHAAIAEVHYPGLQNSETRSDHETGSKQFRMGDNDATLFGSMLSFELSNRECVDKFISNSGLLFCPSLGDLATTISYPVGTSHRGISPKTRAKLGISDGLVRISTGIEPISHLVECVNRGLVGLDDFCG